MIMDVLPMQVVILVPCQSTAQNLEMAVDIPDTLYAEWSSTRDAFQKCQAELATALKAAQDAKKPSSLIL